LTITKTRLKESISNRLYLPKNQASKIVESLLGKIEGTLAAGEDILISGFGKSCVKEKNSRRVVKFGCSSVLKEKMNRAFIL